MKATILTLGLTCLCAGLVRADFNPVPLTPGSFTFDIVVEKTSFPSLQDSFTASQGQGTNRGDATWFEKGFWRGAANANIGLPAAGTIFTNQSKTNIQYIMPPTYATNNGLLADNTQPGNGGTLTLATPTTCSGISIFGTSGGGTGTWFYQVNHADASVETGTLTFNDWFNGANPAFTPGGRVGTPGGGLQNNGANPRLYSQEVVVGSNSPVVSVALSYAFAGGTPAFYAISTTTDGTNYVPAVVSGFNQRIIVQATPQPYPITATMDQGTNLSDNGNLATWFEQGYVVGNLTNGLPPSGSVFNSLSQPTHHYQMGDYSTNNAILIDTNHQTANITPASPAPFTAFALLTAGGNVGGGHQMTNVCILQHADGVNETNNFIGYDWFEGSVPGFVAFQSGGRANFLRDRSVNNIGTTNPKLFETYFVLSDTGSPVTNIVLKFKTSPSTNSTTFIMAVSATAGGIAPIFASQPSRENVFSGGTASFAVSLTAGTTPVYIWQKGATATGPFSSLSDGGHIAGSSTSNLVVSTVSPADVGYYQVIVSNAVGTATSVPVPLYMLTSTNPDILSPGDVVSDASFNNNPPPQAGFNETVTSVLDHTTQKYLCYGVNGTGTAPYAGPSGFIVTPGVGSTIVSALRIYTANDGPERDPADIQIEGSTDGGTTWNIILADTALSLPDDRNVNAIALNVTNQVLQEVDFANTTTYTSYRVTFNNVKTNATAIGLQFSEIELLGVTTGAPTVVTPFTLAETNIVIAGNTVKLSVSEGGAVPLTNSWSFNNVPLSDNSHISGSQSNVLTITNVQFSDAGFYKLNISNSGGTYTNYPGGGADQNLTVVAAATLFTNGIGWKANGNPALVNPLISGNTITLTDGATGEARSAFFNSPVYIGAFQASFIYQDVGSTGGTNSTTADGMTLCLQNDPRGTAALGGGGGALAVSGITPSAELAINIYNGSQGGPGTAFGINGVIPSPYNTNNAVDVSSGNPIAVTLVYGNGVAKLTLTDTVTLATFTTNMAVGDLTAALGAQTALVGFTGATGGIASTQTVTDFAFVPLSTLTAKVSGSNVILSWPTIPGGYSLQSESTLTANSWSAVGSPVTVVGTQNQVTIPISAASQQYYRLTVPVPAQ